MAAIEGLRMDGTTEINLSRKYWLAPRIKETAEEELAQG